MDWCVRDKNAANHAPVAVLNGHSGIKPVRLQATPGSTVTLDATGSNDSDGHRLTYQWMYYPEAGDYEGNIRIAGKDRIKSSFTVPKAAAGKSLHIILMVQDTGEPVLTGYRRMIIEVE